MVIVNDGSWVVASDGAGVPMIVGGKTYVYVYNYRTHEKAYYCIEDSTFLTNEIAEANLPTTPYIRLTCPIRSK